MTELELTEAAFAAIDAANAQDPNVESVEGVAQPKELVYGRRMTGWLERLRPDAPTALRIAAKAQHIRRWEIPRDSFDMDRRGYLMWRKRLYAFHAECATEILRGLGAEEALIERVAFLLQKRQLNSDADTQSLEDAACLVFLEFHFHEFLKKTAPDKIPGIVQKTWGKMSAQAHEFALGLPHTPEALAAIKQALGVA